jgi:hypothetical protein
LPKLVHPPAQVQAEPPQPVTVHFHGGTCASTLLADADLEDAGVDSYEELIEKAITEPPKPHWCWIGDIYAFTQAISGFELADTTAD